MKFAARLRSLLRRAGALPVLAMMFAVLVFQTSMADIGMRIGPYDEGLLLTGARAIQHGEFPYRDFYSNYPPGSILLVRLCAILSHGHTIYMMRMLAFGLRLGCAALVATVVGRLAGRNRLAAFAAVGLLQFRAEQTLFGYVTAVTLALAAIVAMPRSGSDVRRFAISGALFGMVSWFRHDLFGYLVILSLLVVGLARLFRRPLLNSVDAPARKAFAIGTLVPVAVFWTPLFLVAGPKRVILDLAIEQAKHISPARHLPLPPFHGEQPAGWLKWTLPYPMTEPMSLGLLTIGAGLVLVGLAFAWHLLRGNVAEHRRRVVAALFVLTAGTVPQALQRADWWHVAQSVGPSVAAVFGIAGAVPALGELALLTAFMPYVTANPNRLSPGDGLAQLKPRTDDSYVPDNRKPVLDAIRRLAGPDDRIYVGCTSHRRTLASFVSIYYEVDRRAATRITQFDPGFTDRDDIQQEMISEMQHSHPAALVLWKGCTWDEPNESRKVGSDRLDRYIADHYTQVQSIDEFELMKPKG